VSFNTDHLTFLTLGIRDDQPFDPAPRLPDGQHFRWSPRQDLGFPWYGFYLFRRESQPRRPRCLSVELRRFRPGTSQNLRLITTLGLVTSAKPLVFSDDFIPAGTVEVDLAAGLRFDLPESVEAASVEVRIGFRGTGPQVARTCIDFRSFDLGLGSSPRTEQGVVFEVEPPQVSPFVPVTSIESWGGSPHGLIVQLTTAITLPGPATRVDLRLTNRAALRITAVPGMSGGTRELKAGELTQSVLTLTGDAITGLTLFSESVDAALLHEICWERPGAVGASAVASGTTQVTVRALAGTAAVATAVVEGSAGQVVPASLAGAGITAVEIDAGPAALVDLCFLPSKQTVTFGWGEVPGFTYPLCLPVAQADYPCPGRPASFEEAQALAFSRVTYQAPEGWDTGFPALHGQLEILVKGGPRSGPMAERINLDLIGDPLGPAPGMERLKLPEQRPLDLVLLASLQPAMAQMLGLYFTDTSAEPGIPYDYLLLADPTGVLGGSAATALEWLAFGPDSNAVDAYLATGKSIPSVPVPPVPPPGPAHAYALPGAMTRSQTGDLVDAQANVGLWWDAPPPPPHPVLGVTAEEPSLPVLYYPWRASLGLSKPPVDSPPPDAAAYKPLLRPTEPPRPVTVVLTTPVKPPTTPNPGSPEWPPPPISFHIVDSGLAEGWYSYRIVGQDIFGRHSALGSPAAWYQWDPPPRTPPVPLPWYYEKGSPGHHSIHPFAVALLDKVPPPRPTGLEATALDPDDRWVLQDEPYTTWREAHKGVVGLRVRWRWTLAHMNQAPDTREFRLYYIFGRLNELPGGIGVDDLRRPTAWTKRLRAVGYNEHVELQFEVSRDPQGQPLANSISRASGQVIRLAGNPDLSGVQPFLDHLRLDRDSARPDRIYKILGLDVTQRTVTLDGIPSLGADSPWTIGRPVRQYEIFLIPPEFNPGPEFEPSLDHPTVFAQIGISAADDKTHTEDDPHWGVPPSPDRFGNEGRVGGPAAIFRVRQKRPEPPELPEYPDKLLATPADYHSDSFFTFRWSVPAVGLKVHVLRALDDSLFQIDRELRPRPDLKLPKDAALFPSQWKQARCDAVAAELNRVNQDDVDYESLSADALRVLAGLPGNEDAFTQITLLPLDPAEPANFDRRGPDDLEPPGHQALPDVRAYLDKLDGRATNRYFYRAVAVDGAHNRSGLSLSTPPVYLPKVEPPRMPVITKVVGGDRQITIEWAANREADLAEYRIYRSSSKVDSRDVRLMDSVATVAPAKRDFLDSSPPPFVYQYYCVVAVDTAGNLSIPSTLVSSRAYDDSKLEPPVWKVPMTGSHVNSVLLSWTAGTATLRSLVQRKPVGAVAWVNQSGWLERGLYSYEDTDRGSGLTYVYRLIVMDKAGKRNDNYSELTA
jgi:hypothetical protein